MTRLKLFAALLLLALPSHAPAQAVRDLTWQDLVPDSGNALTQAYDSMAEIDHTQPAAPPTSSGPAPANADLDGERIRIPGYVIPLDFASEGVTSFLLVPYVGACIHVPPPPPNQLILVETDTPQSFGGLFEAVMVTGVLSTSAESLDLADVAYSLQADRIDPYE